MTIKERLTQVQRRISEAALRAGRDPGEVQLVAVSKLIPVERIREGIAAGIRILGENRIQEAKVKVAALEGWGVSRDDPPWKAVKWHLVGHLQTNKAKLAIQLFKLIHSLDSLRLAQELNSSGRTLGAPVETLVQVKLAEEEAKAGLSEDEILPLLCALADLPFVRVRGLMILPPYFSDPEEARPYFRRLRQLQDRLKAEPLPENVVLTHLSMGMSHDFEVAIEEGATIVRIGTAIFGPRNQTTDSSLQTLSQRQG